MLGGAAVPARFTPTGLARRRADGPVPACPACRVADEEVRRWFFFYESETNADESVRDRLIASAGLCSAHTRRLLDHGPAASWLATGLFDLLLHDARDHRQPPSGRTTQPSRTRRGRWAPCPVCDAVQARVDDLFAMLISALDDAGNTERAAEVADAYRAGAGLCVSHARAFLRGVGSRAGLSSPPTAELVASVLADRLATTPDLAAGIVTGDDTDAAIRARLRTDSAEAVLREDARVRRSGLTDRIEALLARACCPICAARVTTTWRLLDWISSGRALPSESADTPSEAGDRYGDARSGPPTGELRSGPPRTWRAGTWRPALGRSEGRPVNRPHVDTRGRDQLAGLCASHIADLIAADGSGGWLSQPVATVVRLSAARWRTWATAVARSAATYEGWDGDRPQPPVDTGGLSCLVCREVSRSAEREMSLLLVLGADPARTADIQRSHGPCQRCRTAVGVAPISNAWRAWERSAAARTAELAFEIEGARHRDTWTARWDVADAELSVWRRAPARLDGMVFGPPSPAERASPVTDVSPTDSSDPGARQVDHERDAAEGPRPS